MRRVAFALPQPQPDPPPGPACLHPPPHHHPALRGAHSPPSGPPPPPSARPMAPGSHPTWSPHPRTPIAPPLLPAHVRKCPRRFVPCCARAFACVFAALQAVAALCALACVGGLPWASKGAACPQALLHLSLRARGGCPVPPVCPLTQFEGLGGLGWCGVHLLCWCLLKPISGHSR